MTEVLAGIDPSTSTGICILRDGKVVHTELLKIKRPGEANGKAYAFFADSLWALFVKFGVQAFAVEMKIQGGKIVSNAAVHDLASVLYGRCEEIAARLNIEMVGVPIQSWRSTFLRKTTAPKNFPVPDHILPARHKEYQAAQRRKWWKKQAMDACEQRGIKVTKDDVAEAVGVAMHLYAKRHPLGWAAANDLFDLDQSPAGARTTLSLPASKTEAERVFANFGTSAEEE
jgi:hypothetical protein